MPTPPAGYSIPIPTGPAPDFNQAILDDPFYKQNVAWLNEDKAKSEQRLLADRALAEQLYALNRQQASQSANSGGDYGVGAATVQANLAKERAAHEDKLNEEYIRESMASRGLYDSGQKQFEQQERQYGLEHLNKSLDADLAARVSAASSARASAQAGLALQLQEMALRHGATMTDYGYRLEDLQGNLARGTGEAAFQTYQRLMDNKQLAPGTKMAAWDDASGLYRTADGQYYDANGNPTSYSPPAPQQAPPAPAYQPPPSYTGITDYGPQPQGPARPGQPNFY